MHARASSAAIEGHHMKEEEGPVLEWTSAAQKRQSKQQVETSGVPHEGVPTTVIDATTEDVGPETATNAVSETTIRRAASRTEPERESDFAQQNARAPREDPAGPTAHRRVVGLTASPAGSRAGRVERARIQP